LQKQTVPTKLTCLAARDVNDWSQCEYLIPCTFSRKVTAKLCRYRNCG